MTLTAGSRVQLTETGGTIERIHADRGTAEVLWDTGARSCDPLDWLTSEGSAQPNPPEPSAAERKEDALYKCVFDAGHQDKRFLWLDDDVSHDQAHDHDNDQDVNESDKPSVLIAGLVQFQLATRFHSVARFHLITPFQSLEVGGDF